MFKHVHCEMTKQEIIKTIVKEYDKVHKEASQKSTDRNIGN